MDLVQFHDRLYGKYQSKLFTFESTWDSFRPITAIGWNGKQIVPIDREFKLDLFSPFYGYGSLEMKQLCRKLTEETELGNAKEIRDPIQLWRWYGETQLKWWNDRPCLFVSPCVPKDRHSWKEYLKYLEVRAKTVRQPFKGRLTRRNLRLK